MTRGRTALTQPLIFDGLGNEWNCSNAHGSGNVRSRPKNLGSELGLKLGLELGLEKGLRIGLD